MKRLFFAIVFGWYLYSALMSSSVHDIGRREFHGMVHSTPLESAPLPNLKTVSKIDRAVAATKDILAPLSGKTIPPANYQYANGRWGVLDEDGNDLTGDIFDELFQFTEDGLALARIGDKFGHVDRAGRWVVPPVFDAAFSFSNGLAPIAEEGKWGYADNTGRIIVPPQFDKIYQFFEDIVIFEQNGKMGYLHKSGDIVLPAVADYARWFREGKGAVQIDGMYGFIDSRGSWVIPPRFEKANDFKSGIALVYSGGRAYYVDERGEYVKDGSWVDE